MKRRVGHAVAVKLWTFWNTSNASSFRYCYLRLNNLNYMAFKQIISWILVRISHNSYGISNGHACSIYICKMHHSHGEDLSRVKINTDIIAPFPRSWHHIACKRLISTWLWREPVVLEISTLTNVTERKINFAECVRSNGEFVPVNVILCLMCNVIKSVPYIYNVSLIINFLEICLSPQSIRPRIH